MAESTELVRRAHWPHRCLNDINGRKSIAAEENRQTRGLTVPTMCARKCKSNKKTKEKNVQQGKNNSLQEEVTDLSMQTRPAKSLSSCVDFS